MTLRLAFVTGATPDRWAGRWRERRREPIELMPVEEESQLELLLAGDVDMALVRSTAERAVDREALGLHLIPLYDEVPVAVLDTDHVLTLLDEVTTADLADEPGVLVVPMSVARLRHRRDLTHRPVRDLPPTSIGLAWRRDRDDDRTQAFAGIVRGRTERSSR